MQNSDNAHIIKDMQSLGMRFGLERTRALLDKLGSPDKELKVIHVAGSNGKGSVCEYLTQILLSAGFKTGTFTSPEVFSFEEQYRVNGKSSAGLTEKYLGEVNAAADKMEDKPTAFERQTAAAFLYFFREGCEYAVIECGLGGLTDATNAICGKAMAVITSVSLEHTAVLGNTLTEIARHKAAVRAAGGAPYLHSPRRAAFRRRGTNRRDRRGHLLHLRRQQIFYGNVRLPPAIQRGGSDNGGKNARHL